jgi:proteasome lid subunit RPN8/RPN11
MGIFKKKPAVEIRIIKKKALQMILESAKSSYPNEFGALLRAEEGEISELILLPGTISGNSQAIFQLYMRPIDFSIVGSAHSHPSGNYSPSEADLDFFRRTGSVHVIVGYPYTMRTWAAYNVLGERIELEVL